MSDEPKPCTRCGEHPVGEGGLLCPECLSLLTERAADPYGPWFQAARTSPAT